MRIVVEGLRGLGGGGAFEAEVGDGGAGEVSLDGLRSALGFFGGGGAALPILEFVDIRCG